MFPRQYMEFCLKKSMERQKIITFKKKFIKKYLFVEEISYFQEQKSRIFPSKSASISMETQCKLEVAKFDFHWFSIDISAACGSTAFQSPHFVEHDDPRMNARMNPE